MDSPGKVVAILKMKTFAIMMMIPDGNFAIFMMIMTIIMIPDVEVDLPSNIAMMMMTTNCYDFIFC